MTTRSFLRDNVANVLSSTRLVLAPVLAGLAYVGATGPFVALLCIAFLTDVIDGKIARWLGQESEFGARLDSWADFAICVIVPPSTFWLKPEVLANEAAFFWIIIISMLLPKLYGFTKFRKLTSYHTRGAALAAGVLGAATLLMFSDLAIWPFRIAAILMVLPKIEEIAITIVLPQKMTMVKSLHVARQHRRDLHTEQTRS